MTSSFFQLNFLALYLISCSNFVLPHQNTSLSFKTKYRTYLAYFVMPCPFIISPVKEGPKIPEKHIQTLKSFNLKRSLNKVINYICMCFGSFKSRLINGLTSKYIWIHVHCQTNVFRLGAVASKLSYSSNKVGFYWLYFTQYMLFATFLVIFIALINGANRES